MTSFLPQNINRAIGAGLTAFAHRYEVGSCQLSRICGGTEGGFSRAAADRLMRGVQGIKLQPKSPAFIERGIREFLKEKKLPAAVIQIEIAAIFKGELEPVTTPRTALSLEAQQYFGLRRDPFALTSNPTRVEDAFSSKTLDRIAEHVEDAIRYQGFVCCVGDIGSGKSTLKFRVNETVKRSKGKLNLLWPDFAEMGRVTSGSIVHFVLESFNQPGKQRLVASHQELKRLLGRLSEQGRSVALGFDEAHHLNDQTLSALKNFYEIGSGGYDRYLGVVLFAQPRFLDRMDDFRFREIAERLDIIRMPALSKQDDAWRYVSQRVKLVGGNADKLFDRAVIDNMAKVVGTPLALGNLSNAGLMKAFEFNQPRVTKDILKSVLGADDSEPRVRAVGRSVR